MAIRPRFARLLTALIFVGACAAPPPQPSLRPAAPSASAASSVAPAALGTAAPVASAVVAPSAPPPIALALGGPRAVFGEAGLVTSVEPHATRVGAEVLRRGGNAIDAAVAVAFALAVTHPSAGNLGGGGFFLVRLANGDVHAIDFRETAPALVTTEGVVRMVDREGGIGYRSAGVPGTVAGLAYAREHYGTLPLAELVAPARELAQKGHRLGARQGLVLSWAWPALRRDAAARAVFGRGKEPLSAGEKLVQRDLAHTLERIAAEGPKGFYEGEIAARFDAAMTKRKGLVRAEDLRVYAVKERTPLRIGYRGLEVHTMPPPSMGGIAVAEMLRFLEHARAYEAPEGSAAALHLHIEASRRAYADRHLVGADPDFYGSDAPTETLARLLDPTRIAAYSPPIDASVATASAALAGPNGAPSESPDTTHFSVVDAAGNAVAGTVTLSAGFGAKVVVPGTGVVLGNALGAFSPSGLNAPAPGKRPASSMAPTLLTRDGRLLAVLGSPGGNTIPSTVVQVLRNLVDHGMTIDAAVLAPRIHHQYLPDRVRYEKGTAPAATTLAELVRRGHALDGSTTPIGDANDLIVDPETGAAWGFADPREGGEAVGIPANRGVPATGL
jgi:gamma-glutamyltranspeptidase/glutathione hydrolase